MTPQSLIDAGALVVLNHSGGKDSQAITLQLSEIVPHDQLVVVHAPLGEVEWPVTIEHIRHTIPAGVPLILAPIASGKTLLERIEERGQFPDPARRWCTSDFKRGPIEREIRRYLKAHPRFGGRVINCMGMRAEESSSRVRQYLISHDRRKAQGLPERMPPHLAPAPAPGPPVPHGVEVANSMAEHSGEIPVWRFRDDSKRAGIESGTEKGR